MAVESHILVRRAGLTILKGDAALAALVDDRVYPPQRPAKPQWPFVAWGVSIVGPFEASCMDGREISFAAHAYAATDGNGGDTVSGEELASQIAGRVVAALLGAGEIDLEPYGALAPAVAHFTWEQTQVIQDGAEADAFHAIAAFRCNVTG